MIGGFEIQHAGAEFARQRRMAQHQVRASRAANETLAHAHPIVDAIDPCAGRVDHQRRANLDHAACAAIAQAHCRAVVGFQFDVWKRHRRRAVTFGVGHQFQREAFRVNQPRVVVLGGQFHGRRDRRHRLVYSAAAHQPVPGHVADAAAEEVVEDQPQLGHYGAFGARRAGPAEKSRRCTCEAGPPARERHPDRKRHHQVRCVEHQPVALLDRFAHQGEFARLQVAQAAMDEAGGRCARAAAEITALNQHGTHALRSEIAQQTDPVDAAANDQYVDFRVGLESGQQFLSGLHERPSLF